MAAVVAGEPGPQRGVDEERMAHPPLDGGPLLHLPHDRGVEADARVEAEVAAVDHAESDPADVPLLERGNEEPGRGDGVVGKADAAGEHVGGPARQHGECGATVGDARCDLVQRAVPAEGDDHIDAAAGRVLGEAGGVTPPAGLHDLHVVALRQHLVDHDGVAGRDRGREGVDDEEQPHEAIDRTTGLVLPWLSGLRGDPSVTMTGHEHRRLRQADPGSGRAGRARSSNQHPQAGGQADPRRVRQLRRRDGAAARRRRRRR